MIVKGTPANPQSVFNNRVEYKQFEYATWNTFKFVTHKELNHFVDVNLKDEAGPWRLAHFQIGLDPERPGDIRFYYIFEREQHVIDYR